MSARTPRTRAATRTRSPADRRKLRRASAVLGAQVAGAISLLMLLTGLAAVVLDEHREDVRSAQAVHQAWLAAPATRASPGIWLVGDSSHAGPRSGTSLPDGAPAAVASVHPAALPDGLSRVTRAGQEVAVWTGDRAGTRISASYPIPAETSQNSFIAALEVAAIAGMAGAVLTGALIGRRAVRPLVDAISVQRHFVTDASHELRSPLTLLQLRAQLLLDEDGAELGADRRAQLELLVRDTKAMADVVTDLLRSARLEHERDAGEPVDLAQIAADVVTTMSAVADRRSIDLRTCPTSCTAADTTVIGARTALRRAVVALVDNALAHTSGGGHITVGVGRRGAETTLSVQDDGEGLDAPDGPRLTGRFIRGTRAATSPDQGQRQEQQAVAGTEIQAWTVTETVTETVTQTERFGLGLALVHQTAQAHGGWLEIAGERGHGARFTLVLPAAAQSPMGSPA